MQAAKDPYLFQRIIQTVLIITGCLVFIIVATVLLQWSNLLADLAFREYLATKGETASVPKTVTQSAISWWQWLNQKMTQVVPIDQEKSILFEHSFDGIRELDNKLPPWWVWTFYLSIVFAFIYYPYYHVFGLGDSSAEKYKKEMVAAAKAKAEYLKQAADMVDENTATLLTSEEDIAAGKTIFESTNINCSFCHGAKGEGGVGPNLTDDYWVYEGDMKAVFSSIKYGRPNGMREWKSMMTPKEIHQVSSYVLSLRGTNPPNAKEPQGELYTPEKKEE